MNFRSNSLFACFALSFVAAPCSLLAALPQGVAAKESSDPALEFRGVINDASGPRFFLVDGKDQSSRWVPLKGSYRGWRVVAYRTEADSITLQNGSSSLALTLIQRRPSGGAEVMVGASAFSGSAATRLTTSPAVLDFSAATANLSALPVDEQQRLNELAAEVKRRQAERLATGKP